MPPITRSPLAFLLFSLTLPLLLSASTQALAHHGENPNPSTTILAPAAAASNSTTPESSSSSPSEPESEPTPTLTRIVEIFFLNDQSDDSSVPYTEAHRDSGSVIAVNDDLTTYVVTKTRSNRRTLRPTGTNVGPPWRSWATGPPTTMPRVGPPSGFHRPSGGGTWSPPSFNGTGGPSTITQGPATFMFTGTRFGANHTVINRCSLNGTVSAVCELTHAGAAWYAANPSWNGTYSTYSYNWTSGDRFGFAPVTITGGVELLAEATGAPTPSPSSSTSSGRRVERRSCWGLVAVVVLGWAVWW